MAVLVIMYRKLVVLADLVSAGSSCRDTRGGSVTGTAGPFTAGFAKSSNGQSAILVGVGTPGLGVSVSGGYTFTKALYNQLR
jgi:hypothetical protein